MPDWIDEIVSAWTGHRAFAEWLVKERAPNTIVELGVDYGYSLCVLANALKTANPAGRVTGIDHFKGDQQTGYRNTKSGVQSLLRTHDLTNVDLVEGDFQDVGLTWTTPVDILHIDGLHTYDAVKGDYTAWRPHLATNGIVLFHDIHVPDPSYEVKKVFNELTDGYRMEFTHSAGLGIYTRDRQIYDRIRDEFPNVIAHTICA
jgi:predicted O-methyltransferase YrrM